MSHPVVFVPGLNCTARLFADQITSLSAGRSVVIANHRRHATMGELTAPLLPELPDRFVLVGLSMGGYVALDLIRRAPERIAGLVLMDTSARPDTDEQRATRERRIRIVEGGRFADVVAAQMSALIHPARSEDDALLAEIRTMADETGPAAYIRQQKVIMDRPDSRPDLSGIACPTLILVGDADAITPPDVAEEMARAIPEARLAVVSDCGHLSALERPARVTAILRTFLAEAGL